MAYDSAIASFTTKTNKVDLVDAAHINAVQAELVTIETILGTGVKGDRANLKTRLNNALDADGSLFSGSAFPSSALPSQAFYRTDIDSFYIRNAANSQWNQFGASLSNVIFSFMGTIDNPTLVNNASISIRTGGTYSYWAGPDDGPTTVNSTKWVKIPGVSTVTVWARIWQAGASGNSALCKVIIGSVNGSVNGTVDQATPEWKSFTIDVSSLTNGSTYDVTVQMGNTQSGNSSTPYLGSMIAFGS